MATRSYVLATGANYLKVSDPQVIRQILQILPLLQLVLLILTKLL